MRSLAQLLIMMLIILLISCEKDTETCTIVCSVVPLPDTMQSGVPFVVDATASIEESTCTLQQIMRIEKRNHPKKVEMYFDLTGEFIVNDSGLITLWVQVYRFDNGWSDLYVQKIFFE